MQEESCIHRVLDNCSICNNFHIGDTLFIVIIRMVLMRRGDCMKSKSVFELIDEEVLSYEDFMYLDVIKVKESFEKELKGMTQVQLAAKEYENMKLGRVTREVLFVIRSYMKKYK